MLHHCFQWSAVRQIAWLDRVNEKFDESPEIDMAEMQRQGVTTCGLSSLASFVKMLSSKRVCCVFCDIRDKNAVDQGFWSKTTVFSIIC